MAKSKAINFKTANKYLLNAISRTKDPKKQSKILKEKMQIYRDRMIKNADSFFKKDKHLARDFRYTLDTIEKRITKKIKNGTFDQKELQAQLNRLVTNSRNYQKQVKFIAENTKQIEESDDDSIWDYIITHPIKTVHSDECAADLAGSPYTKEQALEIMSRKPNHINCTCRLEERKKVTVKQLIQQGNF